MKDRDDNATYNAYHTKHLEYDAVRRLGDPSFNVIIRDLKADWIIKVLQGLGDKTDGFNQISYLRLAKMCKGPLNLVFGMHIQVYLEGKNAISVHIGP